MVNMALPEFAVLDGGMAVELVRQGFHGIDTDPLWSSRLLQTNPEAVYKVHTSWLEAGSDIIETNTYQASVQGFREHLNLTNQQSIELIQKGAQIAIKARDDFWEKTCRAGANDESRCRPLVAGSCGPYGACLRDGSEYTGSYIENVSEQELLEWHRPRVDALVQAEVDLLAFETVPSLVEARAMVKLLESYPGSKAWVVFSCKDELHTCRGEPFRDACDSVADCPQVVGVGINCSPPQYVTPLLKQIKHLRDKKRLVVYPNSGEMWTREKKWVGGSAEAPLPDYVEEWVTEGGATWVGGCCRVYPSDVAQIRNKMAALRVKQGDCGCT